MTTLLPALRGADGTAATVVSMALLRSFERPHGIRAAPDGSLLVAEQADRLCRFEFAGDYTAVDILGDGPDRHAATTLVGARADVLRPCISRRRRPDLKHSEPAPTHAVPMAQDFLFEENSR